MKDERKVQICVPVCVQSVSEIDDAVTRAGEVADIVEVRIDCLTQTDFLNIENEIPRLFRNSLRPVILTFRPSEQGGRRELNYQERLSFWFGQCCKVLAGSSNYADVEIDLGGGISHLEQYCRKPYMDHVICSHHDHVGIPADLEEIYRRMTRTKARILKIAVQADEITDCIPVLRLLERARSEGQEMISIAMGDAGILTRILGPSRGGFLTYGSLDDDHSTAPGQVSATELRDLYRIHTINERTEIMGVVGRPVMHSTSPQIHNDAFSAIEMDAVYIPFDVLNLESFVFRMVHPRTRELNWNLRGLSITAPHKSEIMKYLDWVDPIAVEIGAVNTVVVENELLRGYNTDALAVLAPLDGLIDLDGACVAVIGAGGAARAILWSLRKSGARVTVFARDVERGSKVATQFGAECETLCDADFDKFEIVVNATPLGTRGLSEDASPAKAKQLRRTRIAYDLVYNPLETSFMREARNAGCEFIGGLQMLVAQAAEQFKLWTGKDAPIEIMRDAATNALGSNEK